ncbi:MAG TPA: 4Fe-4S dicluster domain-containing protein [Sandaracinaceae bacterium LLY-WYZ-13_1]|nr:4Fe-4S dicluster domain-containing protein [Sandaracinaceae bacterium LLY-WYZ-13_1]
MSHDDPSWVPAASLGRRSFLGASAGTLGALAAGCDLHRPEELVPYVRRPPEVVPGVSDWYATAALRGGYAIGLLAESREGRPLKIEGHPEHPMSRGGTGPREQASVLTLYDRDRLEAPREDGTARSWAAFARSFGPRSVRPFVGRRGEGLALWLPPSSSAVLARRLAALRERYPRATIVFDPTSAPTPRWEGTRRAFGRPLDVQIDLARADRAVFLDADALVEGPAALALARDWAHRRTPGEGMLRTYAFEGAVTSTGVSADHRLPTPPGAIGRLALALLAALRDGVSPPEGVPHAEAVRAVARDLDAHRGRSAVVAGERQPAAVHALAALLNATLGNVGRTVRYRESALLEAASGAFDPSRLFDALDADAIDTLVIADANPVYAAPPSFRFAERAARATRTVACAAFANETAASADWALPSLHPLERWGLHHAHDGTPTARQPLIEPLVDGTTPEGLIARLLGEDPSPREAVAAAVAERADASLDEVLSRGFFAAADETVTPRPRFDELPSLAEEIAAEARADDALALDLRPDARVGEGEDAENAWLQELPEASTQLVWDNAALLAPAEMARLGLRDGDVVALALAGGDASVRLPVLGVTGQAEGTVVAWLGFGRRRGGRVARRVGVDVTPLRTVTGVPRVHLEATGERRDLARTQHHHRLEHDEPIYRRADLEAWRANPRLAPAGHETPPPSLHEAPDDGEPSDAARWAMAIDLSRCTGCKACVIACQAENDVPAVGKTQVALGREMHWLRIDRYLTEGDEVGFQPMLCQHCEHAPCEYVCPTNATVHSPDGLNVMAYNRCVGTRFCQNNCPYHVRRFNWFDYQRGRPAREQLVHNPDVSVRGRGVMEKCTFCVQRIRRAERYGEPGGLRTACQQACPSEAIAFGDRSDPSEPVSRWQRQPRAYSVLGELGTRPRVQYLARVDHPNPGLRERDGER